MQGDQGKKKQKESTNQVHDDSSSNKGNLSAECSVAYSNQEITFMTEEDSEDYNFDTYNSSDVMAIDKRLSFYDWLGDSATTSHITNSRQSFTTFQSIDKMTVSGVGNVTTLAEGRGTAELESNIDGHTYILQLKDVLYIPLNNQNLISLGCWDNSGRHYIEGGGIIMLVTKDGKHIAKGHKISNNLYKMDIYP
jgi:hypothetical protein